MHVRHEAPNGSGDWGSLRGGGVEGVGRGNLDLDLDLDSDLVADVNAHKIPRGCSVAVRAIPEPSRHPGEGP